MVNDGALLCACASKVDARCFDAFMSHEIGKERNVIELLQKVLGESMPKRVRVNDRWVQLVLDGELFQLHGNATRRDALTVSVDEDEPRRLVA